MNVRDDTTGTQQVILDRLEGIDSKVTGLVGDMGGVKATLRAHGKEITRLADLCSAMQKSSSETDRRLISLESDRSGGQKNGRNGWGRVLLSPIMIPVILAIAMLVVYAMSTVRGDSDEVIQQRFDRIERIGLVLNKVEADVQSLKQKVSESPSSEVLP